MPNVQLPNFITAENELDGNESVYIAQSSKTRKTTLQKIKDFILGTTPLTTTDKTVRGAINEVNLAKVNNWLEGKTINFMGDSITHGFDGTTKLTMNDPYPSVISRMLDCVCNNYGIGSSKVSGTGGMCDRVLNMDTNAVINVIFGGTNDWGTNVPLGTIISTDKTTVYGALNVLCDNLVDAYPNAINILMTPLKRNDDTINTNYSISSVVNAIKEVAQKYNFLVIDLYNEAINFNPNNATLKSRWSGDGLHPNQAYVTNFLAPQIARLLLNLDSNSINSITNISQTFNTSDTRVDWSTLKYSFKKDSNNVVTLSVNMKITFDGSTSDIVLATLSDEIFNVDIPAIGTSIGWSGSNTWQQFPTYISLSRQLKISQAEKTGQHDVYISFCYRNKSI